jgi:hypothetical protein
VNRNNLTSRIVVSILLNKKAKVKPETIFGSSSKTVKIYFNFMVFDPSAEIQRNFEG